MSFRPKTSYDINSTNPAFAKLRAVSDQAVADCARYILESLEEPMGARVTYAAACNVTIKFSDSRVGSLSISSVPANADFLCRWNLHTGECVQVSGKYKTHWYPIEEAHNFVSRVQGYQDTILANSTQELKPPAAPAPAVVTDVPLDIYVTNLIQDSESNG